MLFLINNDLIYFYSFLNAILLSLTLFEVWKCSHFCCMFCFFNYQKFFFFNVSRKSRFDHRLSRIRWRAWIATAFSWQKRISILDVSRRNHLKIWLNSSLVYLLTSSLWIHRISSTSAAYVASFALMISRSSPRISRRRSCTGSPVGRFSRLQYIKAHVHIWIILFLFIQQFFINQHYNRHYHHHWHHAFPFHSRLLHNRHHPRPKQHNSPRTKHHNPLPPKHDNPPRWRPIFVARRIYCICPVSTMQPTRFSGLCMLRSTKGSL